MGGRGASSKIGSKNKTANRETKISDGGKSRNYRLNVGGGAGSRRSNDELKDSGTVEYTINDTSKKD